jgi:hypothetical protein
MSDEEVREDSLDVDQDEEDSADFEERNEAHLRELYEDQEEDPDLDQEPALRVPFAGKAVMVDRAFIARLLEKDRQCRVVRSFPLLTFTQMKTLASTVHFQVGSDVLHDRIRNEASELAQLEESEQILELHQYFPSLTQILEFGEGHLVVAGGAVTSICTKWGAYPKDCDFFFHGISTEEAEKITQKVIKWWLEKGGDNEVYRNPHCTTLIAGERGEAYQLVHRCYQSPDEVIGGFDLGPCAVLFDGHNILATEMGAFSLVSRLMIVDVSRRSRSFSERISKYNKKGFTPVFLTKNAEEIRKILNLRGKAACLTVNIGERCRVKLSDSVSFPLSGQGGYCQDRSDYDNGQDFNTYAMTTANTLMAVQDKPNLVCWGGKKWEDIVGDNVTIPRLVNYTVQNQPSGGLLHALSYFYWKEHFPQLSLGGQKEALHRWFGQEFREWRKAEFIKLRNAEEEMVTPWAANLASLVIFDRSPEDSIYSNFLTDQRIRTLGDRAEIGFARAQEFKGKLAWLGMGDNPTRQLLTSSVHPVTETMSFYNPQFKNPLHIGIPFKVCCTLLAGRKERECNLYYLPRDVFNMVMKILRRSLAVSPMLQLLSC